ncbi:dTDP-4-dehydrorhamnose 3,5-epimerase family protein [Amycolatopsis magusensis]|uniref:dTDP-4-dehydrorhamnose 3,5-epimerase family protein n=1 Tax=Amycolatopsis magusensis TaxID=882444 RepID=UPI0024A9010A|nr:dTDP-4-dehydrorhamnose 3,5-epimerase family protein [Amycolatopsis magusensis]MDI5980607.1 dTDP-4-dehydrorhamnose 3,5-epimerase family protein [Amycolatopsis magusensis]
MQARELAVRGAIEFTPRKFPDERGSFVSPHQGPEFLRAVGEPLFDVAQASYTTSRRGAVRGIHYTRTPPGCAKYVYCPSGRVLDFVVDVRVGSETFGRWDSVVLDPETCRSVYLPIGVGHACLSLADDSVLTYLLSQSYSPEYELNISLLDAQLGSLIPAGISPIMSERDRRAPTLAEAMEAGLLPAYATCLAMPVLPRAEANPLTG